jgi:2-polyprenyl-3-methyl-5-hydroxy-6-metoxy-1,4-benzoquinol methylase
VHAVSCAVPLALLFFVSPAPTDQPAAQGGSVRAIARRFNKLYSGPSSLFNSAPNAFLARTVSGLKPGRALDVAMGQGRNSVFLAKQGWEVTGYDIADSGLEAARSAAATAGVRINAVHASHEDFEFGREQWDLIVMTYALADMENASFLRRLKESVKPGGVVVVEQMNSGGTGKGPANALLRSFQDLRVIQYEDTVDTAEWGLKNMRIGRIVAQKD